MRFHLTLVSMGKIKKKKKLTTNVGEMVSSENKQNKTGIRGQDYGQIGG